MKTEIREDEVLRYLGYQGREVDSATLAYIRELKSEIQTYLTPKYVYGKWRCRVDPAGIVTIENIEITSKNLASHMAGCERVILFAATLGTQADTIIRRYNVSDSAKAAIAQAVCSVMLESCCDDLICRISAGESAGDNYLKPRFSPGYGDFSLHHQKDVFSLLDCTKRIGITLTDSFMMIPAKSVTALAGITKEKHLNKEKCGSCGMQCKLRKECGYGD